MNLASPFPSFLSALASNNTFIIKLVKMWLGRAPRGGRNFESKVSFKAIHTGPNASKASLDDAAGLEPILHTAHSANAHCQPVDRSWIGQ